MIISGTELRKSIIAALNPVLDPVNTYSFIPPVEVLRYVYLSQLTETALDDKRAFLSEGTIAIQIVEKFDDRSGNLDWVNNTAKLISETLTPNRLSTFGIVSDIDIFTMRFGNYSEDIFESEPGRTAIGSLRLDYKIQKS